MYTFKVVGDIIIHSKRVTIRPCIPGRDKRYVANAYRQVLRYRAFLAWERMNGLLRRTNFSFSTQDGRKSMYNYLDQVLLGFHERTEQATPEVVLLMAFSIWGRTLRLISGMIQISVHPSQTTMHSKRLLALTRRITLLHVDGKCAAKKGN